MRSVFGYTLVFERRDREIERRACRLTDLHANLFNASFDSPLNAPIIPVYLDRLWGSIFSHESGRFLSKIPKEIPYLVTVAFGEALDPNATPYDIRQAVQELGSKAWEARERESKPLQVSFVHKARLGPAALAFADAGAPRVFRLMALIGAVAMARVLKRYWAGESHVGIVLPPCVGGALANLAASLAGRTSVNLNYTVGRDGMESAIKQTALKTVFSSRATEVSAVAGCHPICLHLGVRGNQKIGNQMPSRPSGLAVSSEVLPGKPGGIRQDRIQAGTESIQRGLKTGL